MANASLFCMDGSRRGETLCPQGEAIRLGTDPDCDIRFHPESEPGVAGFHAEVRREPAGFSVVERNGRIFVNGDRAPVAVIRDEDVIQLGEGGPRLRFRAQAGRAKTVRQMIVDSADVSRTRKPGGTTGMRRMTAFARQFAREAIRHSTRRFRVAVTLALVVLASMAVFLAIELARSRSEQSRLRRESSERETAALQRAAELQARLDEIRVQALEGEKLGRDLVAQMKTAELKLLDLEKESTGARDAIEKYGRGVCLLVAAIHFADGRTHLPIRHAVDRAGQPRRRLDGSFVWTTEKGEGNPRATLWVTGTGFLVSKDGLIVTNRHVADPWSDRGTAGEFLSRGAKPVRGVFQAYFPGVRRPFRVARVRVDDDEDGDVGLLIADLEGEDIPVLPLAPSGARQRPGEDVILIGYPTGLAGLVNKLGARDIEKVLAIDSPDYSRIAAVLAERDLITPFVTEGVLSNVLPEKLVYDAVTTKGGSGGPVITRRENLVIGINHAVLEKFTGANFGVPVSYLHRLIAVAPDFTPALSRAELDPADVTGEPAEALGGEAGPESRR